MLAFIGENFHIIWQFGVGVLAFYLVVCILILGIEAIRWFANM